RLGLAVMSGALLRVAPARWQPALGGAFPLSLPAGSALRPGTGRDDEDALAARLREDVVDGPVRTVTEMVAAMSVPAVVLWGNVAPAGNRAASSIAPPRARPGPRAPAVSAPGRRRPPLAGAYAGAPVTGFRRRSCCLIYRVSSASAPAFCGDCILLGRE